MVSLSQVFSGRRVLVTGHTGFKGSWLCEWLLSLGADVTGIALAPATTPALFNLLGLSQRIRHHVTDVRDIAAISAIFGAVQPEVVFHLAAQPLVRLSYREPRETWEVNVGGTVNVLEAVRASESVRACVVVTSDKCYDNREWPWGYRESDPMGGHDPYSSSKGAAELAVASWRKSFLAQSGCRLASARAGNVIGGGDWAADRIVVDFVTAVAAGRTLSLRNPQATRPWQHVLEPLSGYLDLAARLFGDGGETFADSWNFGPAEASVVTVGELARYLVQAWGSGTIEDVSRPGQLHEAGSLKLDCSKARSRLGWHGIWDVPQTVAATVEWYRQHHQGRNIDAITREQISTYTLQARHAGIPWAYS